MLKLYEANVSSIWRQWGYFKARQLWGAMWPRHLFSWDVRRRRVMEKCVAADFSQETGVAFLYNLRWEQGVRVAVHANIRV